MIGIRGSGASLPITDATATAADIVSGKVAYNNNGRIVGTHTESGIVITDATATAADIVSGKIAYNNTGRIVGTHTCSGSSGGGGGGGNEIKNKDFFLPSGSNISGTNNLYAKLTSYDVSGGGSLGDSVLLIGAKSYFSCTELLYINVNTDNATMQHISDTSSGTYDSTGVPIEGEGVRLNDDIHNDNFSIEQGRGTCTIFIDKTTLYINMDSSFGYGVTVTVYYK